MYQTMIKEMRENAVERAKRARTARLEALVLLPFIAAVVLAYHYRVKLFGIDEPIRVVAAIALVILGWAFARTFVRALAPPLLRRLGTSTAATVGFLIRLAFLCIAVLVALRIAGLQPREVAIGGAITVVILGLASQQTLGNVIAGIVLISARPFRAGEHVRLQGSGLAGETEGVVESLGLLYTILRQGADTVMVPNSVVLGCAVIPLREPQSVNLRARLRPGVRPSALQELLESAVMTEMLEQPHIALEEVHADEVIVRITAIPATEDDGPRLADEILAAIAPVTREAQGNGGPAAQREDGPPTEPLPARSPAREG